MNILNAIKIYRTSWEEKEVRPFTQEEMDAVEYADIHSGDYGLAVCLHLKSGGKGYIPLDIDSDKEEGDTVDLSKASLVTLSREGDKDIYRVRC